MANHSDTVLLCRFCGRLNPVGGGERCAGCGAFSGLESVTQTEGIRRSRRTRLEFLRNRVVRAAYIVVPLAALLFWVLWVYTGLPPDPPLPSTDIGDTSAERPSGEWPQARGGVANAGASALNPGSNSLPGTEVWRYVVGAPIVAAPAVVGDRVYVTAEDGTVTALTRDTGEVVWQYESRLPVTVTPAVADGLVFVVFRPGVVSALEADTGELVWSKRLPVASLPAPTIADGRLFVAETDENQLLALDAATGEELWDYRLGDWVIAPPVIANGRVMATSNDARVHIIDVKTGQRQMVYDAGQGRWVRGSAAVSDGLLHFSSYGGRIWGIDYSGHRYPLERPIQYVRTTLWVWGFTKHAPVQQGYVWSAQTAGEQPYPPALTDDVLVVADAAGFVSAVDIDTGDLVWETDLGEDITAPATVAGELALVGLESGEVVALSVADGTRVWLREFDGAVTAEPVLVGGTLLTPVAAQGGTLIAAIQ